METREFLTALDDASATGEEGWDEEAFFGDADFANATLEGMAAFAEEQETILLEELRAEVA